MNYNTYRLDNGLRIIHLPSTSPIVYCGFAIAVGTRHEDKTQYGMAHFCEHMTFKGTEKRSSLQVINALERYGGELNAFTTKEDTFYYAAILKEYFPKAVDLLTDIVFNSTYPQAEIDKEVEVICDEIESYNDTPADLIYDEFENLIFKNTPLGHNILGASETVRGFKTTDAEAFTKKHYTPSQCVFYVYGDVDLRRINWKMGNGKLIADNKGKDASTDFVAENTPSLPAVPPSALANDAPSVINIESHQAHVMIGTAIERSDEAASTLFLLNNILGGPSMNSRFNISLREKRGLVYSVDSTMTTYRDALLWTVYLGCDPHDITRCRRLITSELSKIIKRPLSAAALKRAKQQLKGQLSLTSENKENFAIDFAKQYLHRGTLKDNAITFARIDAVSADDLQRFAAQHLSPDRLTTLIMK